MTDERIDFAAHVVALLLLTGFAWFFGRIVATAYGPIVGDIAGGFLCLSMTTRYAVNATDEDDGATAETEREYENRNQIRAPVQP